MAGWGLAPASNVDTIPFSLRADFKDQYRYMIAAAYSATGNLIRARARLGLLGDTDSVSALSDQTQRMLANNTSQDVLQTLADLSQALQAQPVPVTATASAQPTADGTSSEVVPSEPATSTPTLTPNPPSNLSGSDTPIPGTTSTPENAASATSTANATPTATLTDLPAPIATATPRATPTSTATPGAPFVLTKQATFCDPAQPGLVQIILQYSSGQQAAGVELIMTWSGGEEHFFTGLKPELGNGYADFVLSPGVEYALSMNGGGTRVAKLIAPDCANKDGTSYAGGIHLEFKQP
jgi:hypothetical protein